MTTTELLSQIDQAITQADQALTKVPKDDNLQVRAAFARLKELRIAKEVIKKFSH